MRTFNQLALLLSKLASHRARRLLTAHPLWAPARSSQAGIRPSKKSHVFSPGPSSYSPRWKTRGLLSGLIYLYANKMSIPKRKLKQNPAVSWAPEGVGTPLLSPFTALSRRLGLQVSPNGPGLSGIGGRASGRERGTGKGGSTSIYWGRHWGPKNHLSSDGGCHLC